MNPDGVPIPTAPHAPKEDPRLLQDQIDRLTRQLAIDRQTAVQTLTNERAKCKAEMDKLRDSTYRHGKDLKSQNEALLQSLGRLKEENDELREKLLTLQLKASSEAPRAIAEPLSTVPVMPSSPTLSGDAIPTMPPRAQ